jgi:hypothetical protein
MIEINIDERQTSQALRSAGRGLEKYVWLQSELRHRDVSRNREYQTRFTGFYRVRRNARWRSEFFTMLEREKSRRPDFNEVLRSLHARTGRVEASFASKLVATVEPSEPVIDSVVLRNLGLALPPRGETADRLTRIVQLHEALRKAYRSFLKSPQGRQLVERFRDAFPNTPVADVKMLDLVLWQTRRRPNIRMEPTRHSSRAIVSPRRAAHSAR